MQSVEKGIGMLRNSITVMLRLLWRQKLFTALNILGLAVGISSCWIIYQIVEYEFSFDQKHPNAERIYQFINQDEREGKVSGFAGIARALPITVKNEISGVELVVPVYHKNDQKVSVFNENNKEIRAFEQPKLQVSVSESYFELVPYQWIVGSSTTAFNSPNQVVLTKSRAKRYFPSVPMEELLGKTIAYNDTSVVSISGIVADLDFASSFNSQEFFALTDKDWNSDRWSGFNSDDNLFVKLAENTKQESVLTQINTINYKHRKESLEKYGTKQWYDLIPLTNKHFSAELAINNTVADKKVLYGLMGVAVFILLLACINYINLSTAQIPQRAKEIGIRKTLGSRPSQLIKRFMGETFLITLSAVLLSLVISFFAIKVFSDFIPQGMETFQNYAGLAIFLLFLTFFITVLSGLYPAWIITRMQTVNVLKGQAENAGGQTRFTLRKGLITFQFVIAQVFVIAAVIIGQQLHMTLNRNLGFDREAVLTLDLPSEILNDPAYKNKQFVLKEELAKNSNITAVALGDKPLSNQVYGTYMAHVSDTGKIQEAAYLKFADEDLLSLYNFEFLAGNELSKSDTIRELIINEMTVKVFGFESPGRALGKYLEVNGKSFPVIGVIKNFHNFSFKHEIPPVVFVNSKGMLNTVNIKLAPISPQQWPRTISEVEQTWKSVYPDALFDYKFYDETIAKLYVEEHKTAKLISLATGITIFISCLGLFGLATLTGYQRIKEIGVRKVLGASVMGIVQLLSKDFVKLVFIAILIATPIAWWGMNKWLQDFAYRIDMEWWMFAWAGSMAVLIALVTVSFQAVKAAIANPVDSLRDE